MKVRDMEVLLAQEALSFTLAKGIFDVDAVAETIAGLGFSFRDKTDPSRFVISSDAESRDEFQARRLADPSSGFPYVLLVTATPAEIMVAPVADHPALRELSVRFLEWLTSTYDCQIADELGADLALEKPA